MKNYSIKINIKKRILAVAIAILPMLGFSQATFDMFEDMDDVTVVSVNKEMFQLMSKITADTQEAKEYISMVNSMNSLRVLATENAQIAAQMKAKVESYLNTSKLTELMKIKDKDGNVKIFIKQGKDKDHVSELFMFVDGISKQMDGDRKPEAVIVSLTGDIDLNKISKLTKEMNIPGGEHLEKAGNQ